MSQACPLTLPTPSRRMMATTFLTRPNLMEMSWKENTEFCFPTEELKSWNILLIGKMDTTPKSPSREKPLIQNQHLLDHQHHDLNLNPLTDPHPHHQGQHPDQPHHQGQLTHHQDQPTLHQGQLLDHHPHHQDQLHHDQSQLLETLVSCRNLKVIAFFLSCLFETYTFFPQMRTRKTTILKDFDQHQLQGKIYIDPNSVWMEACNLYVFADTIINHQQPDEHLHHHPHQLLEDHSHLQLQDHHPHQSQLDFTVISVTMISYHWSKSYRDDIHLFH